MIGFVVELVKFLVFMLVLVFFNFVVVGICLFIGIVCKDYGVVNLIGSLVMLFSLFFVGLLLNYNVILLVVFWFQWLLIFYYGFEVLIVNEVVGFIFIDYKIGIDIIVFGVVIFSLFGFDNLVMWMDIINFGVFGVVFIILVYVVMYFFLVERRQLWVVGGDDVFCRFCLLLNF